MALDRAMMQSAVGKAVADGLASQAKDAVGLESTNAELTRSAAYYNFPPLLKFFHYDPSELDPCPLFFLVPVTNLALPF